VVPVYGAQSTIEELTERVSKAASQITEDFEIIYVDDYSRDESWRLIEKLAATNPRVRGIKFSRNFGQHYALTAGLDMCRGDWTVIMDCDLQDQPEFIGELHDKALAGYEVVLARRADRDDGWLDHATSTAFYRVFNALTGSRTDSKVGTYRIMSRKVVETFRQMPERHRFFGGMIEWMGFATATIDVARSARSSGESGYTLLKRFRLATDAVVSFSNRPLVLAARAGLIVCLLSIIASVAIVVQRLRGAIPEIGFASVIVSIFFLSGVILLSLGLMGAYLGRIYDEVKGRPSYIIDRVTS
jgi:dolichol-phosphate mannosyltransferase